MRQRLEQQPASTPDRHVERLISEARNGNEAALAGLLVADMPRLRRWAHGRVPSSMRGHIDTIELSQEVALLAVKALTRFRPAHTGSMSAFTRRIATNRLRDEFRRQRRRPRRVELASGLDEEIGGHDPSPEDAVIARERETCCRAALLKLRSRDRRLLQARYYEGLDMAAIARKLGMPTGAAAGMALRRAEARCRQIIDDLAPRQRGAA